ncbi:MAG: FapA family protein [Spirochaetota bacterium]|nr:FapA family protein [Spirochaetota bacterium]
MSDLKNILRSIEDEEILDEDGVEVYADSVKQALELTSKELQVDISMLDYEIIEKGVKGFWGFGRKPYRVLVKPIKLDDSHDDILEIEKRLGHGSAADEIELKRIDGNVDGECRVRVTKSGVWLTVTPPRGRGKKIEISDAMHEISSLRIANYDVKKLEKLVKSPSLKSIRIGDWIPNPEYDGSVSIEVAEDEMKAYAIFSPPHFSGKHLELDEVLDALDAVGVVSGIEEDRIKTYLDAMNYRESLCAAEGRNPTHGRDARIDYKVRIDKSDSLFEEDEKGQVDFRNLDLLENVVVGQLLAVKVSADEGTPGRTVKNRILPAKSGKDIVMKYGKGTILSEDGLELTAEINGQVVFQNNKISIEPVYIVKGDVSLETGNIIFLGSIVISGNVQDNFIVRAAGNIEVKGSVQKAFLESEGDIIVRQGIVGRDESKIESTGGSVYAKFIQTSNVIAEKDVIVSEGILHSHVDAGDRILCNGRRARIVGGVIRAGGEVNARYLGSDSFTKTEIRVGTNPKVLQQISELKSMNRNINEELNKVKLDINTIDTQKKNSGGYLPPDKEELHNKLIEQKQKLTGKLNEIVLELDELKAYIQMLGQKGKVCVERNMFPGVDIHIKDERFSVKDPYTFIKVTLENDDIRLSEYEVPELGNEERKIMTISRTRR